MAVRQRTDGRWTVYYRDTGGSGKIKEEYFGRGATGEAAARRRQRELGVRPYARKKKKPNTGPEFLELAQAYVQNKQFSQNSKKHLLIRLEANILPFFGQIPADTLTHSKMDQYVKRRVADGVKFSTIAREITDVKAILNWSVRRHPPLITINPVRDFQKPTADDAIIFPPTADEMRKIIAAAPDHLRRAIFLAYYAGMRPGPVELLSLKWNNVDFRGQMLHVLSAHKGGPIRRAVDIHPAFLPMLQEWHKQDQEKFGRANLTGYPIVHYRGRPVKRISKTWKTTMKKAKITRRIRPYDLRHGFITRALEGGADLKAVSEIVGSSPRTIMQSYQHVSNPLRKQTIANMEQIDAPDHTKYGQKT